MFNNKFYFRIYYLFLLFNCLKLITYYLFNCFLFNNFLFNNFYNFNKLFFNYWT